ncbi:MAG TPA: hypothetical protein VI756_04735 [Blastocatellia bacterium]
MINILSVKCSLAFAPYLLESLAELRKGGKVARSIKQGGSGFVIRGDANGGSAGLACLSIMHQHRTSTLGPEALAHYQATIAFRSEVYDIARTSDEVILASVNDLLLMSHPQSEIWLSSADLSFLANEFCGQPAPERFSEPDSYRKPDWLNVSSGGGRLLVSDQRTGRWVLLSAEHIAELERRAPNLGLPAIDRARPPVILVKGVTVHLQSAFRLLRAMQVFLDSGVVEGFSEQAATFRLAASPAPEGLELRDADSRVALTKKECGKWADLIGDQLRSLNASEVERGDIRTVFVDDDGGRWVLQWADEILVPRGVDLEKGDGFHTSGALRSRKTRDYLVVLNASNGNCVALSPVELHHADC